VLAVFVVAADLVAGWRARRAGQPEQAVAAAHITDNDLFVKGWFLVSFILVYLPFDFQIHMLNGWQIPIAILATRALFDYILPFARPRLKRIRNERTLQTTLVVVLLLAVIPTNVYLWTWRFVDLRRHDYPYYLHKEELMAMKWIEANAQPEDVVLSSLTIGQYIPLLTGAHAYLGHWAQTLDFFNKSKAVDQFFASSTRDATRVNIVRDHGVDYIFVGPAERGLGNFDLGQSVLYERVYASPLVSVFRVKDNS
jgi:hypothetical protein